MRSEPEHRSVSTFNSGTGFQCPFPALITPSNRCGNHCGFLLFLRQLFVDAEGNMLKEGDTVKYEKLADTLEKIAERGAEEFYTGDTARDLISDIQEAGLN